MTTLSMDALVFGPGLPAAGSRGSLELAGELVVIRAGETVRALAVDAVQLREVGFGRPGVELAWDADAGRWAAHVLDAAAAARLLAAPALAGSPQVVALAAARRRRNTGRLVGVSALALFLLLPVIVLGLFLLQADRLADWVTQRIPVETELRLGRAAFESMQPDLSLLDSGPAYDAVQQLGARLTEGSKYRYEFHVAKDPAVNAFALPGGIVVVNTGLIEATTRPEELAGVLAHEVQHVEQRHSLEAMTKQLGLRAVWVLMTGDLGGTLASEAALQLAGLRFSRAAESEADAKGFELLVERGIDPGGMPAFFEQLQSRDGGAPPALFSTHPPSAERSRALVESVTRLGGRRFEPLPADGWPPR